MAKIKAKKERKQGLKVINKEKSKRQEIRKRFRLIILLLIVVLFGISIAEFAYFFYNFYITVYDVFLRVDYKVGVNVDVGNSTLDLGIIPPGSSVKREIVIVNTDNRTLAGRVISKGDLAEFLSIERNFIIEKDGVKSLSIIANVPLNTKIGNYQGKIILIFRRI